jgi:hypothetical protein
VRLERADGSCRSTRPPELGQLLRLLDERSSRRPARAVDQARVELALGGHDRLARLAQVRDVVQRVVEAEDVDPALGRAGDEAAREVAADRARADEEAPAKRHRERRLRPRLERADPLPGLSTPRRTAVSKTPPPETSRYAKPAPSSSSASRSRSAVGIRPAAAPG